MQFCKSANLSWVEDGESALKASQATYLSFLISVMATESAPKALAAMRATRPANETLLNSLLAHLLTSISSLCSLSFWTQMIVAVDCS